MATLHRLDALCAPTASRINHNSEPHDDPAFEINDLEQELQRLAAANQELLHEINPSEAAHGDLQDDSSLHDNEEFARLRNENEELKARLEELDAIANGREAKLWQERQREYEMLLEEKSEVIRSLHQKLQEASESALGGPDVPPPMIGTSGIRLGQAEEILRLKREMEEQRRQLEQDEDDMMAQMRQMEMTMAKERAEMARQRQEIQRLQNDLARELENSSRAPELRERLQNLRRSQEPTKQTPVGAAAKLDAKPEQKSSGFFRRIFG